MKATIEIEMDNAAFEDAPNIELARILRVAADKAERGELHANLRDLNGNKVGEFQIVNRYSKS